ncbi:hypothetical protein BN381_110010 [Candidatus Microthrix parvicella RN1]|uniref:Uncharacterized protein n=1 Tax=Candidatus Neomicrothrix parvicella RN1 TaxID=1229780 RepID=R4YW69_9ACTN|nr:hypothetical protein BN381_110010 [Candidatus Microthrix parvicella RN1]
MSRTDLDATGLRSTWVINPPLTAWPTDDDLAEIVDAYDPSILLPTTRPSNHSRRSSRSLRTSRRCASVWQPSPTKSPKPSGDRRISRQLHVRKRPSSERHCVGRACERR